jgi:hypothetical protein
MLLMSRQVMGADPTSYKKNGDDWTALCASGKRQSGIDLITADYTPLDDESAYFHYENIIGDKDSRFIYKTEKP